MDFDKPPGGPVTPLPPGECAVPADEDLPVGADWFIWDIAIDAARRFPVNSGPVSVVAPGYAKPLLAAKLCWKISTTSK